MIRAMLCSVLVAVLVASGCARSQTDSTRPDRVASRGPDLSGYGRLRSPGGPSPSSTSLAESRGIDEAQRLIDDGLYDQARARLDALVAQGSRHPQVFSLQAQLAYQQGDAEIAIPWCDRAIEASPLWIEPRIILAHCYVRVKRLAAAASVFEDLDRIAPDSPWGPYGMGVIAAMRGDTVGAASLLDRALGREADHAPSLEARANLARMVQDVGLEERLLGRYVAVEPSSAAAHARLGELALGAGRRDDARRWLERAYALDPQPAVARQLAELARHRSDAAAVRLWSQRGGVAPSPANGDAGAGDRPRAK
ncbi:MAG: tetratricopeptide repeat protein [Planctomycetes bacterium]|nr:tetratricopeptide repeat protein [Planctomycetota bacterium]